MIRYLGKTYDCAMEMTLDLIGGKWKSLILWHLALDGTLRFGMLRKMFPKVTQKMLTQQLRELERDGLVHREVYQQVPPKVEYSLTEMGRTLVPVLGSLCDWGNAFMETARYGEGQEAESGVGVLRERIPESVRSCST
jgi:DNA-binding HxlR family transcriptional regulator